MNSREGDSGSAVDNGSNPRLASLAVAATRVIERDVIDDALEGVVMTVDDLVRDLETEALESRRRASLPVRPTEPAPATPPDRRANPLLRSSASGKSRTARNMALMAVALLLVVVIEYLVLEWIIARP